MFDQTSLTLWKYEQFKLSGQCFELWLSSEYKSILSKCIIPFSKNFPEENWSDMEIKHLYIYDGVFDLELYENLHVLDDNVYGVRVSFKEICIS